MIQIINKAIKYRLLLFVCLSVVIPGYTQSTVTPPVFLSLATPNAASFTKFIDNPIGLYNGNPDINIPVYTLKDGVIELPIALRYNCSGIRVDEEASWVGLGWNLNVGGQILQVGVGKEDSPNDFPYFIQKMNPVLPFDKYSVLNESTDDNYSYLTGIALGKEVNIDPDVYYLSYPGFGGKFVMINNNNETLFLKKEQNIKVECLNSSFPDRTTYDGVVWKPSFKVTTPEGVIHYFLRGQSSRSSGYNFVSTPFLLKETEYPNGQKVYYNYNSYSMDRWTYHEEYHLSKNEALKVPRTSDEKDMDGSANYNKINPSSVITCVEYYLSEIQTTNYKISFIDSIRDDIPNNNLAKKLTDITIQSLTGNQTKKFHFSSSCFYEETSASNTFWNVVESGKRLRLDSFEEIQGNTKINTYRFIYNNTKLPRKSSFAVDYWGFYNGELNNKTYLPNLQYLLWGKIGSFQMNPNGSYIDINYALSQYNNPTIQFANREYNFTKAKAAMLETVIYPTGGQMTYTYEPNTFTGYFLPDSNQLNNFDLSVKSTCTNNGCGIKVSQIDLKESNNTISTKYNYGAGILYSQISFVNTYFTPLAYYNKSTYNYGYNPNLSTVVISGQNSISNPYANVSGVGYSNVEEVRTGADGSSINTNHEFYNESDIDNVSENYTFGNGTPYKMCNEFTPKDYRIQKKLNGLPKSITSQGKYEEFSYDSIEIKFLWGARITDNINRFPDMYRNSPTYQPDLGMMNGSSLWIGINTEFPAHYTVYMHEIPCYSVKLKEKITAIDEVYRYDDYTYDPNTLQLVRESAANEDGWDGYVNSGNLFVKTYTYPNDYSREPYTTMASKNIINKVVEEKTFKNDKLVASTYNEYAGSCLYMPNKRYYSEILNPVASNFVTLTTGPTSIVPNSSIYPRANVGFDHYDSFGNLMSVSENNAKKVVYLWSYNHQFPIAEVWNATYPEVLTALGFTTDAQMEALIANPTPDVAAIRNNLTAYFTGKPVLITTYTYKAFEGIQTKTDPRGVTTYYTYDSFGRLLDVKNDDSKLVNKYFYHYGTN